MSASSQQQLADGRVEKRVENYSAFWQKDKSKETDTDLGNRLDSYTDVVNGYYDGATELYEYGWAQSLHFSLRAMTNQHSFNSRLQCKLSIRPCFT